MKKKRREEEGEKLIVRGWYEMVSIFSAGFDTVSLN